MQTCCDENCDDEEPLPKQRVKIEISDDEEHDQSQTKATAVAIAEPTPAPPHGPADNTPTADTANNARRTIAAPSITQQTNHAATDPQLLVVGATAIAAQAMNTAASADAANERRRRILNKKVAVAKARQDVAEAGRNVAQAKQEVAEAELELMELED